MSEVKRTYKLYQLSDRISEIEEIIENLEGVDIPADLHQDYLNLLQELDQTNSDFTTKVDSIFSLIQSRKRWLEIRKAEAERLQKLVKKDEKTIAKGATFSDRMASRVSIRTFREIRY